ncbi:MAG TPA: DUF1998 domain-containing protein [Terriglobia bacterium]|nr:DUF1998 domain-containing protein [Terriglobia bacterium]
MAYALQRGIQMMFQVEEQEVAVELIGEEAEQRILFWEAAEGGTGVWPRLLDDAHALANVAAEALKVCHFDVRGGSDLAGDECSHACYDCLLSYRNQLDHPQFDRHIIRDYLLALSQGETLERTAERTYDEQYTWLEERRDKNSGLEGEFLALLHSTRRRLPDRAQYRPNPDVYGEADFYYDRHALPGACTFCDGPDHDEPQRKARDEVERGKLEECGYRVIVIRHSQDLEAQLNRYADVFGPGAK